MPDQLTLPGFPATAAVAQLPATAIPSSGNVVTKNIIPFRKVKTRVTAHVPGSKSITNRALILAALADGPRPLTNVLFSRDTRIMIVALRELGFKVEADERTRIVRVHGLGGEIPAARATLHFGNSGTTARFLTAMLVRHPAGEYHLDGDPALRVRPMSGLLNALASQGATATAPDGSPATHFPFTLRTSGFKGGAIRVDASESSQILSALLMAAPDMTIELEGKTVSLPFIKMTARMIEDFAKWSSSTESGKGLASSTQDKDANGIEKVCFKTSCQYKIQPDATAASYFFALPIAVPLAVAVKDLESDLQGDTEFIEALKAIGMRVDTKSWIRLNISSRTDRSVWTAYPPTAGQVLPGGDFDFNDVSDTFLTLAALAPLLATPLTIRGVAHARKQETDRVFAAATELERLGQRVVPSAAELRADPSIGDFTIYPDREKMRQLTAKELVSIRTYEDHRMAMSFAILGCHDLHGDGRPWLAIEDPACCGKTFPGFFEELERLRKAQDK